MALEKLPDRWRVHARRIVTYDVIRPQDSYRMLDRPSETAVDLLGGERFVAASRRRLFVVDRVVWELYGATWRRYWASADIDAEVKLIDAGEEMKTEESVQAVLDAMIDFGVGRLTPVVAIGGGVVHDVVGHAVNRYHRGVCEWVFVGTTAVALFDAGYGAKVGTNSHEIKNLDGGFKPATVVFLDVAFLSTLDEERTRDGMAELIKVGLMTDPLLIDLIIAHGPTLVEERFQPGPNLPEEVIWDVMDRGIVPMAAEQSDNLDVSQPERWPEGGHDASKQWEMILLGQINHGRAVGLNLAAAAALTARRRRADGTPLLCVENRDRALLAIERVGLETYHPVMEDRAALERALHGAEQMRLGQALAVPVDLEPSKDGSPPTMGCAFLYDTTVDEWAAAIGELRVRGG